MIKVERIGARDKGKGGVPCLHGVMQRAEPQDSVGSFDGEQNEEK